MYVNVIIVCQAGVTGQWLCCHGVLVIELYDVLAVTAMASARQ